MKDFIICALVALIPVVYVTGNVHGYEELLADIESLYTCTPVPDQSHLNEERARL